MLLLAVPVILWAKYGTLITITDVLKALVMPLVSAAVGAVVVLFCGGLVDKVHFTWLRLIIESAILFGVYLVMILVVMKQKAVYISLLRDTGIWPLPGIMKRRKSL
jgi:hypothetical protein